MKLVTYEARGAAPRAGALLDDGATILDLLAAREASGRDGGVGAPFTSVQAMIECGNAALDEAYTLLSARPSGTTVPLAEATLRAPVHPPVQMRDCLCFEGHLVQAFRNLRRMRAADATDPEAAMAQMERDGVLSVPKTFYEQPIYYKANRFAVVGTGQDVIWPAYSESLDFELEFGVFIARPALDVAADEARGYIYGYTIFNDVTARDAQMREMGGQLGPAKGKDFDTGNPMGPCLVTADDIPDPYDLTMIARVNGEEWTRASSRSMHWSFETVIAHVTRSETLHPGEFLGSGTVEGGCGLEHMRFLQPGDLVELEVERIGVLRNRIVRSGHGDNGREGA